jgi:hypothetical protein
MMANAVGAFGEVQAVPHHVEDDIPGLLPLAIAAAPRIARLPVWAALVKEAEAAVAP